jgi:hypothetical protein
MHEHALFPPTLGSFRFVGSFPSAAKGRGPRHLGTAGSGLLPCGSIAAIRPGPPALSLRFPEILHIEDSAGNVDASVNKDHALLMRPLHDENMARFCGKL